MKYLMTYKNGRKALGLSTINRGLAIEGGNRTLYPLLVAPTAYNASCVRFKVNDTIQSIAYVPSLIIPGVMCGKSGDSYTDPTGIYFVDTFYRECFYDRKYGEYVGFSKYTGQGGDHYEKIAISIDGYSWIEYGVSGRETEPCVLVNTKHGVIVIKSYTEIGQYTDKLIVTGVVYYRNGNTIQSTQLFSISVQDVLGEITQLYYKVATDNENSVVLYINWTDRANNQDQYWHKLYHINLNTFAITSVNIYNWNGASYRITALWYNRILKKFFYTQLNNIWTQMSADGLNYIDVENIYKESLGNLNGAEIFADGISYDGINIAQGYTYRPNTFDPVNNKYIRVEVSFTNVGYLRQYYYDIYESSDLINWTKVMTKVNPTPIWAQALTSVNADGFAGVEGFD